MIAAWMLRSEGIGVFVPGGGPRRRETPHLRKGPTRWIWIVAPLGGGVSTRMTSSESRTCWIGLFCCTHSS